MSPDQLRAWRRSRGLSQRALAAALGRHWTTVASWEQGRRPLPPDLPFTLAGLDATGAGATTP